MQRYMQLSLLFGEKQQAYWTASWSSPTPLHGYLTTYVGIFCPHQEMDLFLNLLIYLWLCWVSLLWELFSSCSGQASHCGGFSGCRAWTLGAGMSVVVACGLSSHRLWSTGSLVLAHWLSCFTACGIFPDWGLNPRLLHWQADSLSLSQQRSPKMSVILILSCTQHLGQNYTRLLLNSL